MAGVGVLLQAVIQLVPVIVFRDLIDQLTRHHPHFATVAGILALGMAALVAAGLIGVGAAYLAAQIAEGVVYDVRQGLFSHLLDQSLEYYTRRRGGDILANLITDVDGIETVLSESLLSVIRCGGLLVAMLVLMFVLDWRLALLTLVVVPLLVIPFRLAGRATYRARLGVQEQLSDLTAYLQETLGLSGSMLVRAFARGELERERFAGLNAELRRRQVVAAMAARWFSMGLSILQAAGPLVLLLAGGLFITHGSAQLGTVLAFSTVIVGQFGVNLQSFGAAAIGVVGSLAMWRRVFSVLDTVPAVADRPGARALERVRGAITFDGVTFAYPGAARPALHDVSVAIEPGRLVALVGPSGAGKTTFSALAARFFDPQTGAVRLDGRDLRELTLASLHDHLGVVFQDTFLFNATLRENLRYGRPEADDTEIAAAAGEARLGELIAELPHGLDTVVGERGHRLSGGEKQRVAIARVLLKDPRILLLDEATAHLDSVSEGLIQVALGRVLAGRTSIVIAHRLSTVMAADLILVLDGGTVVARGTHQDLLGEGGLYAQLYANQFSSPLEVAAP